MLASRPEMLLDLVVLGPPAHAMRIAWPLLGPPARPRQHASSRPWQFALPSPTCRAQSRRRCQQTRRVRVPCTPPREDAPLVRRACPGPAHSSNAATAAPCSRASEWISRSSPTHMPLSHCHTLVRWPAPCDPAHVHNPLDSSVAAECYSSPPTPPPSAPGGLLPGAMHDRATDSKRRSISGAQRVKPFDQNL